MLYHVSDQSGLKILKPHTSTHKKPYVYAIKNKTTGLLFGVKHDDFDFILLTDEHRKPSIYECYPDAFQKVYQGKSCFVYEVSEEGFLRGMTSWSPELVSEQEVPVIHETEIPDLYKELLEEEKNGQLQIHRYNFSEAYRRQISSHIVDRIIRFQIDLDHIMQQDQRFATFYQGIVKDLTTLMDGHLLL